MKQEIAPTEVLETIWALYGVWPSSTRVSCVRAIEHWILHHGQKWAIARLQQLSLELLGGEKAPWSRHSNGDIKGPFRHLYRVFHGGSRKKKRAVVRCLQLGGLFTTTISRQDYRDLAVHLACQEEPDDLTFNVPLPTVKPLEARPEPYPMAGRAFMFKGSKLCSKAQVEDHLEALFLAPSIVVKHRELLSKYVVLHSPESYILKDKGIPVVGSVTILVKDRKLKKRPIFNLAKFFQLALSPLQQALVEFVSRYPEYCLDQRTGHVWTQEMLNAGEVVTSLDLEAASDNLYLGLQVQMLNTLFPHLADEIALFQDLSRAYWRTPYPDILVKFERGQPLGILVSFLSFSTLILVLLKYLLNGTTNPHTCRRFSVVGDDVVVLGAGGARAAQSLLDCGGKIQFSKTIFGSEYALFGGKILDRHGSLEVYKLNTLKWTCPLMPILLFGVKTLRLLARYVPKAARFYALAPAPFGVGNRVDLLEQIPWEIYEAIYKPRPLKFATEGNERTRHRDPFGSAFALADMDIPEGHPLYMVTQYEHPGTLVCNSWSSIVDVVKSESLNTLTDLALQQRHAAVLSFLLHRKEHLALPLGVTDPGLSNKPKGRWAIWKKVEPYIPLKSLDLYRGITMISIGGYLAASLAVGYVATAPTIPTQTATVHIHCEQADVYRELTVLSSAHASVSGEPLTTLQHVMLPSVGYGSPEVYYYPDTLSLRVVDGVISGPHVVGYAVPDGSRRLACVAEGSR